MCHLGSALEQRGYIVLLAVGLEEKGDGNFAIKIASHATLRRISDHAWGVTRETLITALDKLRHSPLDDLEMVRREESPS